MPNTKDIGLIEWRKLAMKLEKGEDRRQGYKSQSFGYIIFISKLYIIDNGANWWCHKYHQWATRSSHARNDICTAKREDLTENTGVMSAEYSPKVKSELFSQL